MRYPKAMFSSNIDRVSSIQWQFILTHILFPRTEYVLQKVTVCSLTVLGELEELSSSSGESSSSSGSVGMAGGSEGRDRVWGKIKGLSATQEMSQDSLWLWSI